MLIFLLPFQLVPGHFNFLFRPVSLANALKSRLRPGPPPGGWPAHPDASGDCASTTTGTERAPTSDSQARTSLNEGGGEPVSPSNIERTYHKERHLRPPKTHTHTSQRNEGLPPASLVRPCSPRPPQTQQTQGIQTTQHATCETKRASHCRSDLQARTPMLPNRSLFVEASV